MFGHSHRHTPQHKREGFAEANTGTDPSPRCFILLSKSIFTERQRHQQSREQNSFPSWEANSSFCPKFSLLQAESAGHQDVCGFLGVICWTPASLSASQFVSVSPESIKAVHTFCLSSYTFRNLSL